VLDDAARAASSVLVSSAKQKPDLQRQVDYPGLVSSYRWSPPVASGVHFRRKGLFTVLERV
jgi:predicted site-specific integrase-resolvase